jgi:hypothetical protein
MLSVLSERRVAVTTYKKKVSGVPIKQLLADWQLRPIQGLIDD